MSADAAVATEAVAENAVPDSVRALFVRLIEDAFGDLSSTRSHRHAHARAWFTSDDRSGPTTFLVVCEGLGLDPSVLRAEVFRRLEARLVGAPVTKTFTCERCTAAFEHTYPLGYGKPCRFCPACKDAPRAQEPPPLRIGPKRPPVATAVAPPAPRPPRRPATPTATATIPAVTTKGLERVLGDLAAKRDAARRLAEQLDTAIVVLREHYGMAAESESA